MTAALILLYLAVAVWCFFWFRRTMDRYNRRKFPAICEDPDPFGRFVCVYASIFWPIGWTGLVSIGMGRDLLATWRSRR